MIALKSNPDKAPKTDYYKTRIKSSKDKTKVAFIWKR